MGRKRGKKEGREGKGNGAKREGVRKMNSGKEEKRRREGNNREGREGGEGEGQEGRSRWTNREYGEKQSFPLIAPVMIPFHIALLFSGMLP